MNIHPMFVHLPIGILVLYTAFEIIRVNILTRQTFYFPLRAILVTAGTLAGFLTLATGDMAEHIVLSTDPSKRALIETHSMFAGSAIAIYTLIAIYYLLTWSQQAGYFSDLLKKDMVIKSLKLVSVLLVPLAAIGFILITITGGLGAAIVYGPETDPLVTFIYGLFF